MLTTKTFTFLVTFLFTTTDSTTFSVYGDHWFQWLTLSILFIILCVLIMLWVQGNKIRKYNKLLLKNKKEILKKNHELDAQNGFKDKMFSIISHDIRNPVANMKALVELLNKDAIQKDKAYVEDIIRHLKEASNTTYYLVENLFSWAKSQKGEIQLKVSRHNIREMIEENIKLLSQISVSKGLQIVNKASDNVFAYFDINCINTVVRNLLSNAIKYCHPGGLVEIFAYESGKMVVLEIRDDGVGIDASIVSKLFDKKEHLSSYGTNNEKGSGLGLKICHDFVQLHKCEIWLESKIDKGTSFFFTLPTNPDKLVANRKKSDEMNTLH
ncbi:MAG: sensor histidine kinase [Cyclobacteriaceae bacterium]